MNIKTHDRVSTALVGSPVEVVDGERAIARLETRGEMAADSTGLVHGGFTFGLADYAAMLAVNHPHVVLGSAQVKFTAPVTVGETMTAEAKVTSTEGKRSEVSVEVKAGDRRVFTGQFTCYILEKHVLDK
ncbi:MAG: hotdog domain-containing protein [Candidatus Bathyarchaeota archaeon]|jgi:acyl-coenzyme A thioesterase PaaI-like protein|nr:hotdog domain-containing protein [Candidatus Bathyarchaeota archaeon]